MPSTSSHHSTTSVVPRKWFVATVVMVALGLAAGIGIGIGLARPDTGTGGDVAAPNGGTPIAPDFDLPLRPFAMMPAGEVIENLVFSANGATLLGGGFENVVMWDVNSRERIGTLARDFPGFEHNYWPDALAFSPDGTRIATGHTDGVIRIWDPHSLSVLGTPIAGHGRAVNNLAFSPDGLQLVSVGLDNTVRVWSMVSHRQVGLIDLSSAGPAYVVAYSPDGQSLAVAGVGGEVGFWDATDYKRQETTIRVPGDSEDLTIEDLSFSPDGQTLAFTVNNGTAWLVSVPTLDVISELTAPDGYSPHKLTFSPGGDVLAGTYDILNPKAAVWDARTGDYLARFGTAADPLAVESSAIAFSPVDAVLATQSGGLVMLWRI